MSITGVSMGAVKYSIVALLQHSPFVMVVVGDRSETRAMKSKCFPANNFFPPLYAQDDRACPFKAENG
jgi:hypothetical protein